MQLFENYNSDNPIHSALMILIINLMKIKEKVNLDRELLHYFFASAPIKLPSTVVSGNIHVSLFIFTSGTVLATIENYVSRTILFGKG